jgi:hypothetical protein
MKMTAIRVLATRAVRFSLKSKGRVANYPYELEYFREVGYLSGRWVTDRSRKTSPLRIYSRAEPWEFSWARR